MRQRWLLVSIFLSFVMSSEGMQLALSYMSTKEFDGIMEQKNDFLDNFDIQEINKNKLFVWVRDMKMSPSGSDNATNYTIPKFLYNFRPKRQRPATDYIIFENAMWEIMADSIIKPTIIHKPLSQRSEWIEAVRNKQFEKRGTQAILVYHIDPTSIRTTEACMEEIELLRQQWPVIVHIDAKKMDGTFKKYFEEHRAIMK